MKKIQKAIVWFRQDLRLSDNLALHQAFKDGFEIIPLFILEKDQNNWSIGEAQKWWLHHSLQNLSKNIGEMKGKLILRSGIIEEILLNVAKETEANTIYWNKCYEPFWKHLDESLIKKLNNEKISHKQFRGNVLFEPGEVLSKQGKPLGVFTPFWKNLITKTIKKPIAKDEYTFSNESFSSDDLDSWGLKPTKNWADGFHDMWTPGEDQAQKQLKEFVKQAKDYKSTRDLVGKKGTSKLSPHLRFGEVSPCQIWNEIVSNCKIKDLPKKDGGAETYLSEIAWREFFVHFLYFNETLPESNYQKKFDSFKWEDDSKGLKAWKKGNTGYPIVDAAMRELWKTGWMHNRARMIVGSFLVKDLLLHWKEGEKWFWYTLLDADLASNAGNWQWVAGTGTDASPYFRIFNPTLQSEKFDPEGVYIKKWVPELKNLPLEYIHEPWKAPSKVLEKAGIKLGENYPKPIVDHTKAREKALKIFKEISPKEDKKRKKDDE